jgi:hypothetical protein
MIKFRKWMWVKIVSHIMLGIAKIWSRVKNIGGIVSYPLIVDIELGKMKYYYYKYGFIKVFKRCWYYNYVMMCRTNILNKELPPRIAKYEDELEIDLPYLTEDELLEREYQDLKHLTDEDY